MKLPMIRNIAVLLLCSFSTLIAHNSKADIGPGNWPRVDTNTDGMIGPGDQEIQLTHEIDPYTGLPHWDIMTPWNCGPGNRIEAQGVDGGTGKVTGLARSFNSGYWEADGITPTAGGSLGSVQWRDFAGSYPSGAMEFLDLQPPGDPDGFYDTVRVTVNGMQTDLELVGLDTTGDGHPDFVSYPWGLSQNFNGVRNGCFPDGVTLQQIWLPLTDTDRDEIPDSIVFEDPELYSSPPLAMRMAVPGDPTSVFFPRGGGAATVPTLSELAMMLLALSLAGTGWIATRNRAFRDSAGG